MIELTAGDGHKFSAYRADPSGDPKGAVVVVQEVFGINSHIRKIADGFAAKGYVAIAPSLFDRVKPGVELGYGEDSLSEGLSLVQQLGVDRPLGDIQTAVDAVKTAGKVAIVGYCWGGYLAYVSGNRVGGLACAIGYYGGGIVGKYREKRRFRRCCTSARLIHSFPSTRSSSLEHSDQTSAPFRIRRGTRI